jgi:EmrB/QacA subfamily drug resistance transporter
MGVGAKTRMPTGHTERRRAVGTRPAAEGGRDIMTPDPANAGAQSERIPRPLTGNALWLSFAAATTGTFMVNLDASVVNVALPVMQHQFQLPIATLQWVVTAYLLVITGLLPLTGRLADALGRRDVFLAGIAVFLMGSVSAALSHSFSALVAARALQGLGGATIMANVMAIIAMVFPLERRGQALGLIGSVVAAGTLAGPPLGGLLTAWLGWPSIFWINVPVGIWGLWGSWRYLPRFPRYPGASLATIDWQGALWFVMATTLLQFGLANVHQGVGFVLLALVVPVTYILIRTEERRRPALIPLHLFKIPAFWRNLASGMSYWILMMFPAFLLPFYLRYELNLSVRWIGLSLVPQALAMILVSPLGGRLVDRRGILLPGRIGLLLFAVADLAFALLPAHPPLWVIWVVLLAVGTASGLYSSPNNAAVLGAVSPKETGVASSLLAIQRNLGRAVGVALASILLSVTWILYGLGPSPSHLNPHFATWFRWGFRGVFWSGLLFMAIGLWTLTDPRPSQTVGEMAPEAGQ